MTEKCMPETIEIEGTKYHKGETPVVTIGPALAIGRKVLIQTVTFYYTGQVVKEENGFVELGSAACVFSTGYLHTALTTGKLTEVEPYPDSQSVFVAKGAIVSVSPWNHALPRAVLGR